MRPDGLILDFGGVISLSRKNAGWQRIVASSVWDLVRTDDLSVARIADDVSAADTAYSLWRDAMSRPADPSEISHEAYVHDFMAADWPAMARNRLVGHESEICQMVSTVQVTRTVRPGIARLLKWCDEHDLPVAVASNALSGSVHRATIEQFGFSHLILGQVYSDEAAVRKPNPALIHRAADLLGLTADRCWYVGDRVDRDILCGHRAGVAATILIPVPGAPPRPFPVPVEPDATLRDPGELVGLLESS
ncbi:HAD family hydrolase [Flaviflexus huanghaiensis]|uniref:HAD family hydrolase n=1 Tax=Flaviflexus huanghaiensis TaxID=1111473 RepID=UPI0015FB60AB|nr:HAD-IA family hydrolase [Flaviflexus huanghaiensis]